MEMSALDLPPSFNSMPLALVKIEKVALLEKSNNNPPFYILIEGTNIEQNVVYYDIEICLQDGKHALLARVKRRFSQIKKFHQVMRKTLDQKIQLPKIPPKKIFGNTNEEFVNERKEALQKYFNAYPTIQNVIKIENFRVFFDLINMDKLKNDPEALKRIEQARIAMSLN